MAMQESDRLAGASPQAAQAWDQHPVSRNCQKGAPWIPTESCVSKPQLIRSDHKELPLRLRHPLGRFASASSCATVGGRWQQARPGKVLTLVDAS